MLLSQLFGRTLREAPADAQLASHQLALRAGLVRFTAMGIYAYLPLGWRVASRLEGILRDALAALGGQEMLMPTMQPAELWKATGRGERIESAPVHVQDQTDREYVLAASHDEVVLHMARRELQSYRDLPRLVYQFQTAISDKTRPPGGLLGARETRMLNAYSFHARPADLDAFYPRMLAAFDRAFARCDLHPVLVEGGASTEADLDALMLPHPNGERTFARCDTCGYAASLDRAAFRLPAVDPRQPLEDARPIATPGCTSIADLAAFVGVPTSQTLKAVFYSSDRAGLVFVVIRGDLEVSVAKLRDQLGGGHLRSASEADIRAVGAEPGYASPAGLSVRQQQDAAGVMVVGDRSILAGRNYIAGANRPGYHLTGTNYPRDFEVTLLADVAQAQTGRLCVHCAGTLVTQPAIELGHCSRSGARYSELLGATYLDSEGYPHPCVMGAYAIDVGRLMAAVIETHHDAHGIIWPSTLAPFSVHLLWLGTDQAVRTHAETIYAELNSAGFAVLYDDREERAGVKFADADLIGCPARVTVSRRSLESGGIEVKARQASERQVVSRERLASRLREILASA